MKKILEGSQAIAEIINLCRPGVVSAYPITPQTHIVEDLAKLKADGIADYEFVRVESEFAAASVVLGAVASGVRAYTATTSQGLLLMTEVLYNIAGLEMPVVMTCANRAVGAPINIWNDQQDAMSVRDSGWIMLFAKTIQEAVDMHPLAYKVAESLSIPVMVNMDGFYLTHTTEEVNIPEQKAIDRYLPKFRPENYLGVENPKTFGYLAMPKEYQEIRLALHEKIKNSRTSIVKAMKDFKNHFGRTLEPISTYKTSDVNIVYVVMGSMYGTLKVAVDELRSEGKSVGLVGINMFRPFPDREILSVLQGTKKVIVVNRAVSLGTEGILTTEIKKALYGKCKVEIQDEIVGLGGKDMKVGDLKELIKK
uniref:Pyruvate ferredoxin oxidoreductase n=1 Tax=candidate division CPR3 bacterium TaxID=2268181 RepID=A0A7C4M2N8_UNCC3